MRARQDAVLISKDQGAPNQDNIGEEADFTGSTRDRTLELETELEEQRITADTLAEKLGGGTGELTESQWQLLLLKDYHHLVLDNYLKNIHASIICKYQP